MSASHGRILGGGWRGQASPEESHFGCVVEGAQREEGQAAVCVTSSHTPSEPAETRAK